MSSGRITEERIALLVESLLIKANNELRPDVLSALKAARLKEKVGSRAREMTDILIENALTARKEAMPICQDTGMAAVFVEIGRLADISGVDLDRAVRKGVRDAYVKGRFRKSVVADPLRRLNTGDNTPSATHYEFVPGRKLRVSVMPKGFGSENKSRLIMLNPTATEKDIIEVAVETVRLAGPDACPPYVLGIGLGGTSEMCAFLAKKALLRPLGKNNPKKHLAALERAILTRTNALGIGVMGLGGKTTALGVSIEAGATHIAGLPMAINVSCHALRSASGIVSNIAQNEGQG